MSYRVLFVLALAACNGGNFTVNGVDADGDGVTSDADCDDRDPRAYPGATEVCDGVDNDCNGTIDDGMETYTFHPDVDADGYGDPDYDKVSCHQPDGWVLNNGDCDDQDKHTNPSAVDVCDEKDNDCNGAVDDDTTVAPDWYEDKDGDGAGSGTSSIHSCAPQDGYVTNDDDCDDTNDNVNPSAPDVCDGVDNDCDGRVDNDIDYKPKWYADRDADGYGDAKSFSVACDQPDGRIEDATDCDDTRAAVHPGAPEICDTLDNNCDGSADDDPANYLHWYLDSDHDGYGTTDTGKLGCKAPDTSSASKKDDCVDTDATIHPNATELCNAKDDDCDGSVDENGQGAKTWYVDADGDGYGVTAGSVVQCAVMTGRSNHDGDCDDTRPAVFPGAIEVCNHLDDDCNSKVDDKASDWPTWYADGDGDGFGDHAHPTQACDHPPATVTNKDDCDDTKSSVFPLAGDQFGDTIDQDCDGKDCEADFDTNGVYDAACFDDVSWYTAQDWCTKHGYDGLAAPRDSAEQAFLVSLVSTPGKLTTDAPWIGLTDEAVEGTWNRVDGTAASFFAWSPGKPDGDQIDNCAQMNWPLGTGTWNDLSCDAARASQAFICEAR